MARKCFWVQRGHIRKAAARKRQRERGSAKEAARKRIANVAARGGGAWKDEIAAFTAPLTKSDPSKFHCTRKCFGGNVESSELVIYNLGCTEYQSTEYRVPEYM